MRISGIWMIFASCLRAMRQPMDARGASFPTRLRIQSMRSESGFQKMRISKENRWGRIPAVSCAGQIGFLFSMRSLMGRTASHKRGSCFVRPMRHFSPRISSLFPMRASFWCLLGFPKGKGSSIALSRERRRRHLSAAGGCLRIEKFLQRKEEN